VKAIDTLPPKANLRPQEVADFLDISSSKVYQLIHNGSLPSKRIDGAIKIPRADFSEWYAALPSAAD